MNVSANPRSDLEKRLADLEARLAGVEKNEEWDAVEPELRKLRLDVWEAIEADQAELKGARADLKKRFGWWDYVNPFDATARDRYKNTVSRKQYELEREKGLAHRLAELVGRFYADKTRPFARELIRIAEKVQRDVPGSWEAKAGAAYGGAAGKKSGDESIEIANAVAGALAGRWIDEAGATAAAVLSGGGAAERLKALSDRLGKSEIAGMLLGPALLSGLEDAEAYVEAFREKSGDRAFEYDATLAGAALLSGESAEEAHAKLADLQAALPGPPDQSARLAAAALLGGLDLETAKTRAKRFTEALGGEPEATSTIVAALLLSARDFVEDAEQLRDAARGSWSAEATLVAAGLLAKRPVDESVAFVAHVQQALSGTWESEALVIAGGILAGDASSETVKAAFLIPGLFRPPTEDL